VSELLVRRPCRDRQTVERDSKASEDDRLRDITSGDRTPTMDRTAILPSEFGDVFLHLSFDPEDGSPIIGASFNDEPVYGMVYRIDFSDTDPEYEDFSALSPDPVVAAWQVGAWSRLRSMAYNFARENGDAILPWSLAAMREWSADLRESRETLSERERTAGSLETDSPERGLALADVDRSRTWIRTSEELLSRLAFLMRAAGGTKALFEAPSVPGAGQTVPCPSHAGTLMVTPNSDGTLEMRSDQPLTVDGWKCSLRATVSDRSGSWQLDRFYASHVAGRDLRDGRESELRALALSVPQAFARLHPKAREAQIGNTREVWSRCLEETEKAVDWARAKVPDPRNRREGGRRRVADNLLGTALVRPVSSRGYDVAFHSLRDKLPTAARKIRHYSARIDVLDDGDLAVSQVSVSVANRKSPLPANSEDPCVRMVVRAAMDSVRTHRASHSARDEIEMDPPREDASRAILARFVPALEDGPPTARPEAKADGTTEHRFDRP
jgi:hypothetical protein